MSSRLNECRRDAMAHATVALGTVYASLLLDGPSLRISELAIAGLAAFVVLSADAKEACDAWVRRVVLLKRRTQATLIGPSPLVPSDPDETPPGREDVDPPAGLP